MINQPWLNELRQHFRHSPTDFDFLMQAIQYHQPRWASSPNRPAWLMQFFEHVNTNPDFADIQWMSRWMIEQGLLTQNDPAWLNIVGSAFHAEVSHQFVLHNNILDEVFDVRFGSRILQEYLTCLFPPNDRHFFFFNRSQGVRSANQRYPQPQSEGANQRWTRFSELINNLGFQMRDRRFLSNPDHAFQAIEELLYDTDSSGSNAPFPNAVIVIEFTEKISPAIDITSTDVQMLLHIEILQRWALDPRFRANRHILFLLTRNLSDIHPELRATTSQIELVDIPLPSRRERLQYIAYLVYEYYRRRSVAVAHGGIASDYPIIQFSDADFRTDNHSSALKLIQQMQQFADLTAGLNRIGIHDIVKRAFQENQPITAQLIRERKAAIISAETGDVLTVMSPNSSLDTDIGGLEAVKGFLKADLIRPLTSGNPLALRTVPAGVLFLGPPGTGKTVVAEALAKDSNVNLVKLGNIRGMYVGQSERNLERALNIIRSMTPVIVFMDELDQSEGRRTEANLDSGVSSRIFSQLLQFMSDTSLRGQVVWIAASNRPDLIDVAMRRPGRFDDKLPFLPPNAEQRADIIRKMLLTKFQQPAHVIEQLATVITECASDAVSPNYTGAELEVILGRAVRFAMVAGEQSITANHLRQAFQTFIPGRDVAMVEYMTLLALQEINDRRFIDKLPTEYQRYFSDNGAEELSRRIQTIQANMRRG